MQIHFFIRHLKKPRKKLYARIKEAGVVLKETCQKQSKSASGFQVTTSVHECDSCDKYPLKEKCIKAGRGKKPLEERHKALHVSKSFQRQLGNDGR